MRRTVEAIDPVTGTLNIVIAKQYSAVCVRCVAQHENFLRSICHDVLGLNYLDGMSKSAADGDTVACAAADRPEQAGKLEARTTGGAG